MYAPYKPSQMDPEGNDQRIDHPSITRTCKGEILEQKKVCYEILALGPSKRERAPEFHNRLFFALFLRTTCYTEFDSTFDSYLK